MRSQSCDPRLWSSWIENRKADYLSVKVYGTLQIGDGKTHASDVRRCRQARLRRINADLRSVREVSGR
jgi:hypothetical protein